MYDNHSDIYDLRSDFQLFYQDKTDAYMTSPHNYLDQACNAKIYQIESIPNILHSISGVASNDGKDLYAISDLGDLFKFKVPYDLDRDVCYKGEQIELKKESRVDYEEIVFTENNHFALIREDLGMIESYKNDGGKKFTKQNSSYIPHEFVSHLYENKGIEGAFYDNNYLYLFPEEGDPFGSNIRTMCKLDIKAEAQQCEYLYFTTPATNRITGSAKYQDMVYILEINEDLLPLGIINVFVKKIKVKDLKNTQTDITIPGLLAEFELHTNSEQMDLSNFEAIYVNHHNSRTHIFLWSDDNFVDGEAPKQAPSMMRIIC